MKKKVIIIFLVIFLSANLVYASLASIAIKRMLPKSGVWTNITDTGGNLIGAKFALPAAVAAVSSAGLTALKWASLVLPAGNVARVACLGLGIAGSLAADYIINNAPEWFAEKKITKDPLGGYTQMKTKVVYYPLDQATADHFWAWGASSLNANEYTLADVEYFHDNAEALAGAQKGLYSHAIDGSWWPRGTGWGYRCYGVKALADASPKRVRLACFPEAGYAFNASNQDYNYKPSMSEIQTMLETDMINGSSHARKVGTAALSAFANAMDNPENNPLANSGALQGILQEALTDDQKTAIEDSAVDADTMAEKEGVIAGSLSPDQVQKAVEAALMSQGLSAVDIAAAIDALNDARNDNLTAAETAEAMSDALEGQGLSAGEIADAMAAVNPTLSKADLKDVLLDTTGVVVADDIADLIAPDKLSLTGVMTSFFNSINSLPILATLRGLTINAGGSSSLCVNLPANYGGTKCYNCAGIQGDLNNIGTAILSICSILSFIYIFKG